jgi:hypothetical protein
VIHMYVLGCNKMLGNWAFLLQHIYGSLWHSSVEVAYVQVCFFLDLTSLFLMRMKLVMLFLHLESGLSMYVTCSSIYCFQNVSRYNS